LQSLCPECNLIAITSTLVHILITHTIRNNSTSEIMMVEGKWRSLLDARLSPLTPANCHYFVAPIKFLVVSATGHYGA